MEERSRDSRRPSTAGAPPLPPAPMAPSAESTTPPALTWATPIIMAVGAGISGVVWRHGCVVQPYLNAVVRYFILAGACMGVGLYVMDRIAGRWPRPVRWGIAMAAGTLGWFVLYVCWDRSLGWGSLRYPTYRLVSDTLPGVAVAAAWFVLGVLFAVIPARGRALWLMPLVGLVWQAAVGAVYEVVSGMWWNLVPGLYLLRGPAKLVGTPNWSLWPSLPFYRAVIGDAVMGLMLGLSVAIAVRASGPRSARPE